MQVRFFAMPILIVEDDQNKLQQLREFLSQTCPALQIVETHSYQAGLRELISQRFDFAILDMSMPTYDITPGEPGGRPRIFGGRELIEQMERRGIFIPAIVFTQFETFRESETTLTIKELSDRLREEHPRLYAGTVYYNPAFDSWKGALQAMIEEIRPEGGGGDQ
jgi:CheY-like chemotaxis protein